ncbi:unnamed protein product [Fraxinus pennsylvanica]|uniref:Uncharacterized protein n=1 Tax=Fraxinus pennsylvanica TaxID=56036 RepID=A0AAD2A5R6_9LAMI|nr:unnamed protein product [Fraxinus pennsylvanica]
MSHLEQQLEVRRAVTKISHLDLVDRPVIVLEKTNAVPEHNQYFQQFQNIMNRGIVVHNKIKASLRDLSRTRDVQACKAARKAADNSLKDLSKELKPLLSFLQSSPQAVQILSKVEELVAKEKELQEKLMLKHSTVVDCYEKKFGG